jgi:hypothetical protein
MPGSFNRPGERAAYRGENGKVSIKHHRSAAAAPAALPRWRKVKRVTIERDELVC